MTGLSAYSGGDQVFVLVNPCGSSSVEYAVGVAERWYAMPGRSPTRSTCWKRHRVRIEVRVALIGSAIAPIVKRRRVVGDDHHSLRLRAILGTSNLRTAEGLQQLDPVPPLMLLLLCRGTAGRGPEMLPSTSR